MDVTAVVVSWNVRDLLRRCLASLQEAKAEGLALEAVVVDNASHDGSADLVRSEFPWARLVENPDNAGFSRGCNQGAALGQGRSLLLLNPDAWLAPGSLAKMVRYLDSHPEVGVAGPRTFGCDGSLQSSRRRFPTAATAFLESTTVQHHFPALSLFRRYYCEDLPEDQEQQVDWLTGACLLIRRAAWEQVGPLDERFFMYFEETDWCWRAHHAGWRAVYLPDAEAHHAGGGSSAQDLPLRHIRFNDSRCKYAAKHVGPWFGAVLRGWLVLTYLAQGVEEALKLALGHRPALRRNRLALIAAVVRSGLRA